MFKNPFRKSKRRHSSAEVADLMSEANTANPQSLLSSPPLEIVAPNEDWKAEFPPTTETEQQSASPPTPEKQHNTLLRKTFSRKSRSKSVVPPASSEEGTPTKSSTNLEALFQQPQSDNERNTSRSQSPFRAPQPIIMSHKYKDANPYGTISNRTMPMPSDLTVASPRLTSRMNPILSPRINLSQTQEFERSALSEDDMPSRKHHIYKPASETFGARPTKKQSNAQTFSSGDFSSETESDSDTDFGDSLPLEFGDSGQADRKKNDTSIAPSSPVYFYQVLQSKPTALVLKMLSENLNTNKQTWAEHYHFLGGMDQLMEIMSNEQPETKDMRYHALQSIVALVAQSNPELQINLWMRLSPVVCITLSDPTSDQYHLGWSLLKQVVVITIGHGQGLASIFQTGSSDSSSLIALDTLLVGLVRQDEKIQSDALYILEELAKEDAKYGTDILESIIADLEPILQSLRQAQNKEISAAAERIIVTLSTPPSGEAMVASALPQATTAWDAFWTDHSQKTDYSRHPITQFLSQYLAPLLSHTEFSNAEQVLEYVAEATLSRSRFFADNLQQIETHRADLDRAHMEIMTLQEQLVVSKPAATVIDASTMTEAPANVSTEVNHYSNLLKDQKDGASHTPQNGDLSQPEFGSSRGVTSRRVSQSQEISQKSFGSKTKISSAKKNVTTIFCNLAEAHSQRKQSSGTNAVIVGAMIKELTFELSHALADVVYCAATQESNPSVESGNDATDMSRHTQMQALHVFDESRRMEVRRALSTAVVSLREMKNVLLLMDDSSLSVDQLKTILQTLPGEDELLRLRRLDPNHPAVREEEAAMLRVLSIPRVGSRLRAHIFKREFPHSVAELKTDVDLVYRTCEDFKLHRKLPRILDAARRTLQSHALHSSANILSKIIRPDTNELQLWKDLCSEFTRSMPDLRLSDADCGILEKLASVSFQDLFSRSDKLRAGFAHAEEESIISEVRKFDAFKDCMTGFVSKSKARLERIILRLQEAEDMYSSIVMGFEPEPQNPKEFMADLALFFKTIQIYLAKPELLAEVTIRESQPDLSTAQIPPAFDFAPPDLQTAQHILSSDAPLSESNESNSQTPIVNHEEPVTVKDVADHTASSPTVVQGHDQQSAVNTSVDVFDDFHDTTTPLPSYVPK